MRFTLWASLLLAGSSFTQASTSPTCVPRPPSKDAWYTAPAGFESAQPGDILRIRKVRGNLTALMGYAADGYNILYRTTDSRYKPTWAVTTFFIPKAPTSYNALLSYQYPYDSAWIDASPSYALYSATYAEAVQALAWGWYVNIPDYEGPLASFTAGVMSGHATIDSIRAVTKAQLGVSSDSQIAMLGYSGGALASEWAAELQVQYAPELKIAGAALGGLTPNITSVLEIVSGSYAAGLAPSGILGIISQYPELYPTLISKLKTTGPYNVTGFLAAKTMTSAMSGNAFGFTDISQYFEGGFDSLLSDHGIQRIINSDGIMGYHGVPQMPLFAYKAIQDGQSPIADTDKLLARYCEVGANILYQRNTIGGHSAESVNGHGMAFSWLQSILNGSYAQEYPIYGCVTEIVTVNITDSPFK